jgi:aerobic carbon-monoxide dehydrogenase medium subunit
LRLKKFHFFNPSSLPELWSNLGQSGATSQFIAGGTDLLVQMKNGLAAPERVISLLRVAELSGLRKDGHGLRIGSLARHVELERSPLLRNGWAILAEAAHKIGSPQIRNLGTIGGNLSNASPAADTAPALLVLQAEVNLAGPRGERRIPLASFWTGPGRTVLQKDEILKEVLIPPTPSDPRGAYLKLGRRKSLDLALVSVAVLLALKPGTRLCQEARVALGAVAPTPIRAREAEKFLQGKNLDEGVIQEAGTKVQGECSPISDVRASAEYRRAMVKVLVERAIQKALGMAIPPTGI